MSVAIEVLKYLLPALGLGALGVVFLMFFPEKVEKLSVLLLRVLQIVPAFFSFAHRKYVKHDIQSRVNDFVRQLRVEVPTLGEDRLTVEWASTDTDKKSFLADGKIVLRLREDDPQDHNFVHGAFLYVSQALLLKSKRYLSLTQRESLDLFVCSKLIEKEKPRVRSFFIDNYLFPKTKDKQSLVNVYLDDFEILAEGKLFFSTFIQELEHLGEKVFGRREDEKIRAEVNELIAFLKPIALRKVGDVNDLEYHGHYCRFGIMFVGKPLKMLGDLRPYKNYFRAHFAKTATETVYLIGLAENQQKLLEISHEFLEEFQLSIVRKFRKNLYYDDGAVRVVDQCLIVLRRKDTKLIRAAMSRGVVTNAGGKQKEKT